MCINLLLVCVLGEQLIYIEDPMAFALDNIGAKVFAYCIEIWYCWSVIESQRLGKRYIEI